MKREMKREKIIIITKKMKVACHKNDLPLSFIKAPRTEGKTFPTTKMVLYAFILHDSVLSISSLAAFRSLVDKVHELIELRSDDNLRATVALLANLRTV